MLELMSESAPVFIAVVFAFALLIGSFLNVIIHRLPIMMEREWRDQAAEQKLKELRTTGRCQRKLEVVHLRNLDPATARSLEGRFDLTVPRSR